MKVLVDINEYDPRQRVHVHRLSGSAKKRSFLDPFILVESVLRLGLTAFEQLITLMVNALLPKRKHSS